MEKSIQILVYLSWKQQTVERTERGGSKRLSQGDKTVVGQKKKMEGMEGYLHSGPLGRVARLGHYCVELHPGELIKAHLEQLLGLYIWRLNTVQTKN